MGLLKLALIGGAAYWAGKKVSENSRANGETGGWQQDNGWGCHRKRQQQQQQHQNDSYHNQGMTRDMQDPTTTQYGYPNEKAGFQQHQYHDNDRHVASQYGRGHEYIQEPTRDSKMPPTEMVKYDHSEKADNASGTVPPAYAGWGGRPLSPQQRMYPQQPQQQQQQQPRAVSPVASEGMVYVDPKPASSTGGPLGFWK